MMLCGQSYLLSRPEPPTGEIGGGASAYMPTPTAADSKGSRNATCRRQPGARFNAGVTLTDFVTLYPTPTATDYGRNKSTSEGSKVRLSLSSMARTGHWPTPTAHNAKEFASPSEGQRNTPTLAWEAGGKLNPQWVEWLMGVPIGWTDLEPLAMDKSPHNSFWRGIISGEKQGDGVCSSSEEAAP
jgi:hypothetical protein